MRRRATNFKNITRSTEVLAKIFARNMLKPLRCQFCENMRTLGDYCPVEQWEHDECRKHIKLFLEQEAQ